MSARHGVNMIASKVPPTRSYLHRCTSCGHATASPLTCRDQHRHCARCRESMAALAALADAVAEAEARQMIAALMQRPPVVH